MMRVNDLFKFSLLYFLPIVLLISIHAYPVELITGKEKDTAEKTLSVPKPGSLKIIASKKYAEHRLLIYSVSILLDSARADGNVCNDDEFTINISAFKKAFPEIYVDSAIVSNAVILEKYIRNRNGYVPSVTEIDFEYQQFVEHFPTDSRPEKKDIIPLLTSHLILKTEYVEDLCDAQRKIQNVEKVKNRNDMTGLWRFDDIMINEDPDLCIVTDPVKNECVISVGDFNRFLSINPGKKFLDKQKTRLATLNQLLRSIFTQNIALESSLIDKKDLLEKQQTIIEHKLLYKKDNSNRKYYDDTSLIKIYDKYYNRFFSSRITCKIGLIGSTDTGFIADLNQRYIAINADSTKNKPRKKFDFLSSIPWCMTTSDAVDESIRSSIVNMKSQECKLLKTPYGHFFCRVLYNRKRNTVYFNDVRDNLTYLFDQEKNRNHGQPDSIIAKNYYRNNISKFRTPDTLYCRTWFVPSKDSVHFNSLDETEMEKMLHYDTLTYKSMDIQSTILPQEIQDKLLVAFSKITNNKKIIGPLSGICGTWYFIIKDYKKGGITIPFSIVKDEIYSELEVQSFPYDSIASTREGKHLLEREVIVRAYHKNLREEIDSLPDTKIRSLMKEGVLKIKVDNISDDELLRYARHRLLDKRIETDQNNMQKWIGTLIINHDLIRDET